MKNVSEQLRSRTARTFGLIAAAALLALGAPSLPSSGLRQHPAAHSAAQAQSAAPFCPVTYTPLMCKEWSSTGS